MCADECPGQYRVYVVKTTSLDDLTALVSNVIGSVGRPTVGPCSGACETLATGLVRAEVIREITADGDCYASAAITGVIEGRAAVQVYLTCDA